jgi:hypothetical protein
VILCTWYFILSPVLTGLLRNWLEGKKGQLQKELDEINQLLPSTKNLLIKSWAISSSKKGFGRIQLFFRIVLVNTLAHA